VWRAAGSRTRIVHHHHNAADKREQATWSPSFLKTLQRAPELIGCSESTCAALNAATARSDARFLPYVTGCPIDEADVSDRAPGLPLRFGYCGRLIPEKGIDTILALADDPHLTGIEWHIHGAGEAYPPERFAGRPHLIYHGAYQSGEEQVSALLKLDALVLFSTHNEGMPLSLIEGMAAGLPWIGTDRGGTRELAAAEGNSVIIAPDARLQDFTAGVRLLADRILAGSTSRVRQRAAYNLGFAPAVAAARWLTFFGATPSASC
jgi:glycosyltransferase involved in cell wall biosynthesis